jgi:hypothetical protein
MNFFISLLCKKQGKKIKEQSVKFPKKNKRTKCKISFYYIDICFSMLIPLRPSVETSTLIPYCHRPKFSIIIFFCN